MPGRQVVVGAVAALAALLAGPVARAQAPARPYDPWTPQAPGGAPARGAPGAALLVYVTVTADQPNAVLLRNVPAPGLDTAGGFQGQIGQTSRVPVCTAPCGAYVPAGATYAVGGAGYRQSPGFELTGRYPRIKVAARVGTENSLLGGIVLAAAGGLVGFVGLGLLPFAFYEDSTSLKVGAAAALGLGIAGFATGISMAAGSETKIELQEAAAAPPRRVRQAAAHLTPFGFVF